MSAADNLHDELVVDTSGWVRIHCDKCGQSNYYDPEFAKTVTECFGCAVMHMIPGKTIK